MVNCLVLLLFVTFANGDPSPASKAYLPTSRYHSYYPSASGRPKDDTHRYTKYYASKYPSANGIHVVPEGRRVVEAFAGTTPFPHVAEDVVNSVREVFLIGCSPIRHVEISAILGVHSSTVVIAGNFPLVNAKSRNPSLTGPATSGNLSPLDSTSGRETWSPSSPWNGTHFRYQTQYVRPSYYPDPVEGSYSTYRYQKIRTPVMYKKPWPYYSKFVKIPEKPKQKKPQIAYHPMGYKKTNYPRVHTPYTMNKYPTKRTIHPYYRRYYQMYAMPSSDMLRNKVNTIYVETESSTPSSATTTENRNDYSVTSEDHTNYNDTSSNGYSAYYDSYEEQTTSEPTATSYDETSTRGYYGDRTYMSSHGLSDNGFRHRFYLVRNEPEDDDDDETIFH